MTYDAPGAKECAVNYAYLLITIMNLIDDFLGGRVLFLRAVLPGRPLIGDRTGGPDSSMNRFRWNLCGDRTC
jgi:hypothetical protein